MRSTLAHTEWTRPQITIRYADVSDLKRYSERVIDAFQGQPGFGVLILSPKAVGFGVNIQAANHVIHYTRSWNPALENQATDRAYRIGQKKPVYVYYPVVQGEGFVSFDERLHELIEFKKRLQTNMLNGTGEFSAAEFNDVLDVGDEVFDERLTIDDAVCLEPDYFEALTAALWAKRGFRTVYRTPGSGDDFVDVVAKTQKVGELIQCKSSSVPGARLDSEGIKDVVTGAASFKARHPGTQFKLVCITNQFFNDNAQRMASLNGVTLVEQSGLKQLLEQYKVTMSDLDRHLKPIEAF